NRWLQWPARSCCACTAAAAARHSQPQAIRSAYAERFTIRLPGKRVGTQLELHQRAACPFAALDVPDRVLSVVRIERSAFPAAVRIIDAAVHAAREEAERIRHPQHDPTSVR